MKDPIKTTSVRMTDSQYEQLMERALDESTPKNRVTFSDVVREAFDSFLAQPQEVEEEPLVRININVPESKRDALKVKAAIDKTSIQEIVESAIDEYLK